MLIFINLEDDVLEDYYIVFIINYIFDEILVVDNVVFSRKVFINVFNYNEDINGNLWLVIWGWVDNIIYYVDNISGYDFFEFFISVFMFEEFGEVIMGIDVFNIEY